MPNRFSEPPDSFSTFALPFGASTKALPTQCDQAGAQAGNVRGKGVLSKAGNMLVIYHHIYLLERPGETCKRVVLESVVGPNWNQVPKAFACLASNLKQKKMMV